MLQLTKKQKIYIGTSIIILVVLLAQLFFFRQDEPPIFMDATSTAVIQMDVKDNNEGATIEEKPRIVIDIKGEVQNPGTYEMDEDDRVQDAIFKAGGETADADLNQINLAEKVFDEMVITIPKKGEQLSQVISNNNNGKISINYASETELANLDGIGPAKAKAIIDYRNKNGRFKKIEDVMNVPGIGEKIFNQIKDKIIL